jgi:stearoyl-CoA desaturase (Delta-9 desaturase)
LRGWRSTGPRPTSSITRADGEGDPHSPVDGFFHAHLGWIFGDGEADPAQHCRHLLRDGIVFAASRTFLLWAALALALPFAIGLLSGGWPLAWTCLLWVGLVRMFLTHHVTCSVNSLCHTLHTRVRDP